ncbi:replication protein A 70 kDa DNA-binding subunit A isoform X1 [Capsella rubella]|uniref:replication protein A 70 kDa DNA-binding subunit A isoform X1 n=2 Tax=Capsella rubella TaxID=81985 RepID=UPI000CD4C211|nr:replication protein A 70 kDa DNA-binding subunit A isoform X1 [Capsella rubella]
MAASFAFLKDVRPYKTAWRVQVKMLHSWRHYTQNTGETLEMVLNELKIHASVRKDLVNLYVNRLHVDDWVFIENFGLSYATGQFRPTSHLYKMAFIPGTVVMHCDPKSDSSFLSLAKFQKIQSGELNSHMLVDVIGQIITIGELENLEANNKPTCKIDFEIRDENDERMACTLWGTLAEQVHRACENSDGSNVIVILRFVKIKAYKGVRSVTNSYDTSQVFVNSPFPEVDSFRESLPTDGLVLVSRERRQEWSWLW